MCCYAYFNEQLGQMKMTLSVANGNEKYDTKVVLKAEENSLMVWMEYNTPVCLQLLWFDTIENFMVLSIQTKKLCTTV